MLASHRPGRDLVLACLTLAIAGTLATACSNDPPDTAVRELLEIENQWLKAVVANDFDAQAGFLDDDWIAIDPYGGITPKAQYLELGRTGRMVMTDSKLLEEPRVRVYGDTAVVTSRAKNSGRFGTATFESDERATDVFAKRNGRWICVLSQFAKVAPEKNPDSR